MPVLTSRRASIGPTDSMRMRVKESRRKQQWVERDSVDSQLLTPPGSPKLEEPIMEELFSLLHENGMLERAVEDKVSYDSALSVLLDEEEAACNFASYAATSRRLSFHDIDVNELLGSIATDGMASNGMHLDHNDEIFKNFCQYMSTDSPPPTNPPSPPGPNDDPAETEPIVINSHIFKSEPSSSSSSTNGDSEDSGCPTFDDEKLFEVNEILEGSEDSLLNTNFYEDEGCFGGELPAELSIFMDEDDIEGKINSFSESFLSGIGMKSENVFCGSDCFWTADVKEEGGERDVSITKGTGLKRKKVKREDKKEKRVKIKLEPEEEEDEHESTIRLTNQISLGVISQDIVKEEILEQDDYFCDNEGYEVDWNHDCVDVKEEEEELSPAFSDDDHINIDELPFKTLDWREAIGPEEIDIKPDIDMEVEVDPEETKRGMLNDHSYAHRSKKSIPLLFSPLYKKDIPGGTMLKLENDDDSSFSSNNGGSMKVLVPLQELMRKLKSNKYQVAQLGPGKKVVRLTGPAASVKGIFGSGTLRPLTTFCVPRSSLFHRHIGKSPSNVSFLSPLSSRGPRGKKSKQAEREGGVITFPNQGGKEGSSSSPSFSSPSQKVGSNSSSSSSPVSAAAAAAAALLTASGRPKKTKTHNNMERMRRIDLRNSFESLKKLVPALCKSNKCSKVEILRRAEEYVRALRSIEKRLVREECAMRQKNEALKLKLQQLQSQ